MARVFATRAYDMTAYNLYALNTLADLAGYNDKPYKVGSTTYADRIEAVMKDGSGSLVFASPSISATPDGDVVGNITGIFHSSNSTAAGVWAGIQGVRVDIQAIAAAWDTPGTQDDQAVLGRMLSGNDTFDLSGQADKAKGFGGQDSMLGKGGHDQL